MQSVNINKNFKLVRDFITVNAANGNNVNCSMLYAMFMNIITVTLKQKEVKL